LAYFFLAPFIPYFFFYCNKRKKKKRKKRKTKEMETSFTNNDPTTIEHYCKQRIQLERIQTNQREYLKEHSTKEKELKSKIVETLNGLDIAKVLIPEKKLLIEKRKQTISANITAPKVTEALNRIDGTPEIKGIPMTMLPVKKLQELIEKEIRALCTTIKFSINVQSLTDEKLNALLLSSTSASASASASSATSTSTSTEPPTKKRKVTKKKEPKKPKKPVQRIVTIDELYEKAKAEAIDRTIEDFLRTKNTMDKGKQHFDTQKEKHKSVVQKYEPEVIQYLQEQPEDTNSSKLIRIKQHEQPATAAASNQTDESSTIKTKKPPIWESNAVRLQHQVQERVVQKKLGFKSFLPMIERAIHSTTATAATTTTSAAANTNDEVLVHWNPELKNAILIAILKEIETFQQDAKKVVRKESIKFVASPI
jgi:hypothetical protein